MPRSAKTKRKTIKRSVSAGRFWVHLPLILIVGGLLLISFSLLHAYFKYRSLSLARQVVAEYKPIVTEQPRPRHIFIRWFIDTDIEDMSYSGGRWGVSDTKASYLLQSARPGQAGNIVIYGHNTHEILGNIRALKGGELITLTTSDGAKRQYRVDKTVEVSPTATQYLEPTSIETLTLYTCSGLLDSQRFIVQAHPI